jgi:hypothetical protein
LTSNIPKTVHADLLIQVPNGRLGAAIYGRPRFIVTKSSVVRRESEQSPKRKLQKIVSAAPGGTGGQQKWERKKIPRFTWY